MVNSVGMSQGVYIAPKKIDGKTHSRKDELTSYRTVLNVASDNLCIAAQEGNMEAYELCTKIIDFSQAKIDSIIAQEDNHTFKKIDTIGTIGKSAVDSGDKIVETADKAVDVVGKVGSAIKAINLIA